MRRRGEGDDDAPPYRPAPLPTLWQHLVAPWLGPLAVSNGVLLWLRLRLRILRRSAARRALMAVEILPPQPRVEPPEVGPGER